MSKVATIITDSNNLATDLSRLLDMADIGEVLPAGAQNVVLPAVAAPELSLNEKNKFGLDFSEICNSGVLDGVLRKLSGISGTSNSVLFNNKNLKQTLDVEALTDIAGVCNKNGIPVYYGGLINDTRWIKYIPRIPLRHIDRLFPEGVDLPEYIIGRSGVYLPGILEGVIPGDNDLYSPVLESIYKSVTNCYEFGDLQDYHGALVDILAIIKEIQPALLAVAGVMIDEKSVDGHNKKAKGLVSDCMIIMASQDPVALDSLLLNMRGTDPLSVPCINISQQEGFGIGNIADIEIVGDDISGIELLQVSKKKFSTPLKPPLAKIIGLAGFISGRKM